MTLCELISLSSLILNAFLWGDSGLFLLGVVILPLLTPCMYLLMSSSISVSAEKTCTPFP